MAGAICKMGLFFGVESVGKEIVRAVKCRGVLGTVVEIGFYNRGGVECKLSWRNCF